jgi:anti-anti-sigma factor
MELSHSRHGESDIIALPVDRLDAENSAWFKTAIADIEVGPGPLLFDLRHVDFIDSMGIGALLGCMRRQHDRGSTMRLFGVTPPVSGIFKILKLHRVFEIYESRDDALNA